MNVLCVRIATLLRVDNSNCSHLGIRCLVDDVLNGEMNEESLLECIPFVCQYAVAVNVYIWMIM